MNFWLVQANNKNAEGWHWNQLLKNNLRNEKPTGGRFQWGGDEWIRKEFRSGDIAFCYQADPGKPTLPGKQFVGLARIDMQGAEGGSLFYLDWWCRMPSVSYAQIKNDDLLGKSEKVTRVGQGTVFTLSKSEAERLLALSNPNQELLQRIRTHLKIELETPPLDTPISHATNVPLTKEANDLPSPQPERIATTTYRILRDTELARQVKVAHEFRCQICGHTIELADGSRYAEAHHIQPLGAPHNGPDVIGNILCLCPNHHAELDYLVAPISVTAFRHADAHPVDLKYVDYHNRLLQEPGIA